MATSSDDFTRRPCEAAPAQGRSLIDSLVLRIVVPTLLAQARDRQRIRDRAVEAVEDGAETARPRGRSAWLASGRISAEERARKVCGPAYRGLWQTDRS